MISVSYNDVIEKRNLVQVVKAATFSSALAYPLSCVGKPGLVLKDKQLEALKCLYAGVYACGYRTAAMASPSAFQTLPFLIDVKLDRTSAPLSERSVVMVISPLVSLSEAIFKVLVCLFEALL